MTPSSPAPSLGDPLIATLNEHSVAPEYRSAAHQPAPAVPRSPVRAVSVPRAVSSPRSPRDKPPAEFLQKLRTMVADGPPSLIKWDQGRLFVYDPYVSRPRGEFAL